MALENKKRMYLTKHIELIKESGLEAAGIEQLIEALGISRGSFYNYFDNKGNYVIELANYMEQQIWVSIEQLQIGKLDTDERVLREQLILKYTLEKELHYDEVKVLFKTENLKAKRLKANMVDNEQADVNWLAERLNNVWQIDKSYTLEGAILFLGMIDNLLYHNQTQAIYTPIEHLIDGTLVYLKNILHEMVEEEHHFYLKDEETLQKNAQISLLRAILLNADEDENLIAQDKQLINGLQEEILHHKLREANLRALANALSDEQRSLREKLLKIIEV